MAACKPTTADILNRPTRPNFHYKDDTTFRVIPRDVATEDLRAAHFAYDLTDARLCLEVCRLGVGERLEVDDVIAVAFDNGPCVFVANASEASDRDVTRVLSHVEPLVGSETLHRISVGRTLGGLQQSTDLGLDAGDAILR